MNEKERKLFQESKWKRLTRQRWFYPTLYITLVAVMLTGVMIYQFQGAEEVERDSSRDTSFDVEQNDLVEHQQAGGNEDEDAEPVMSEQESLVIPTTLGSDTEVLTNFYDVEASAEDQENALIFYNNQYYQSQGVDFTSASGEEFDVIAALSGTVLDVREDQLLGTLVELEHEEEKMTVYASLSDVTVEPGEEVSQGDVIGRSGENVYTETGVSKVHFQLIEDGQPVNPGF
ncbi:M23 family metallopeptidase [Halalkalibacillus halophilus]|uniref:M23 family metallopeptidase n=1 Tax=Halalkalibacillus halophilus TaxID=392827 RepID=UPI0003F77B6B|nr:M23 family metallopeptidase [Halalkalibacillus halophilus]